MAGLVQALGKKNISPDRVMTIQEILSAFNRGGRHPSGLIDQPGSTLAPNSQGEPSINQSIEKQSVADPRMADEDFYQKHMLLKQYAPQANPLLETQPISAPINPQSKPSVAQDSVNMVQDLKNEQFNKELSDRMSQNPHGKLEGTTIVHSGDDALLDMIDRIKSGELSKEDALSILGTHSVKEQKRFIDLINKGHSH